MSAAEWLRDCRWRLVELVRHHWGHKDGDFLTYAINEYLASADRLAQLHVERMAMIHRLHKLDPPPKVDRDNGVRFTGD
jgi:hypothetical protein